MSENLKNILSHLSTDIDQETLLLYLQNKLSDEKRHEIEKILLESNFEDDAVEGLQQVKDKEEINYMVEALNRDLKKKLQKKKKFRDKMLLRDQPWLYMALLILLLLIVISFIAIRRLLLQ